MRENQANRAGTLFVGKGKPDQTEIPLNEEDARRGL